MIHVSTRGGWGGDRVSRQSRDLKCGKASRESVGWVHIPADTAGPAGFAFWCGRRKAALGTGVQRGLALCTGYEMGPAMLEEFLVEAAFAAGLDFFELIEKMLVDGKAGLFAERAGMIPVFDSCQKTEIGRFEFRESVQGFDFSDKTILARQDRSLACQIGCIPGHDVGEQSGGFVIHVMAGNEHGVSTLYGHFVEKMTFELATDRADGPFDPFPDSGNGQSFSRELHDFQGDVELCTEPLGYFPGQPGGFPDSQIKVQSGDVIAELLQLPGDGQGILAPADGHEQSVFFGEHPLGVDGPFHLPGKEDQVTLPAECRVMTGQGHHRRLFAAFALHLLSS